jgi:hypothetical protein
VSDSYETAQLAKQVMVLNRQIELLIAALDRHAAMLQKDMNARASGR